MVGFVQNSSRSDASSFNYGQERGRSSGVERSMLLLLDQTWLVICNTALVTSWGGGGEGGGGVGRQCRKVTTSYFTVTSLVCGTAALIIVYIIHASVTEQAAQRGAYIIYTQRSPTYFSMFIFTVSRTFFLCGFFFSLGLITDVVSG